MTFVEADFDDFREELRALNAYEADLATDTLRRALRRVLRDELAVADEQLRARRCEVRLGDPPPEHAGDVSRRSAGHCWAARRTA